MSPLVRSLIGAAIAGALLVSLGFGLTRDPRVLKSELVGKTAPPFVLRSLDGKRVSLDSLRGRPLVINFWASWCTECRKEHPLLMAAHDRLRGRVAFVGVIFKDTPKNVRSFLVGMGDRANGSYANLRDPGARTAIDYGVYGVPETFFVDRRGVVRSKRIGRVMPDLLSRELAQISG